MFRDLSIRYKLILLLLGVVSLVSLAVATAIAVNNVRMTRAAMAAKYSALAKVVAANSAAAVEIADLQPEAAEQVVADLAVEALP